MKQPTSTSAASSSQLSLSDTTLQAFGSVDIFDWFLRIAQGLPKGLWNTNVVDSIDYQDFKLFKDPSTVHELFSTLPSILHTLKPCQDVLNFPLVEASTDCGGTEEFCLLLDRGTNPQKIRLPLGKNDVTDVLIERSFNSVRLSFKFTTAHVELRTVLVGFMSKLHANLNKTFSLSPRKSKTTCFCTDKENDEIPRLVVPNLTDPSQNQRPRGISASVEYLSAWTDCLLEESVESDLDDWLSASLFRKQPVPGFHLTLLILPVHVALVPHRKVMNAVWRILASIETIINKNLRALYNRCNMLGEAYVNAFERDLMRAYDDEK